jgi:hypothetical protein
MKEMFVSKIHGHFSPSFLWFATRCLCWYLPQSSGGWNSDDYNSDAQQIRKWSQCMGHFVRYHLVKVSSNWKDWVIPYKPQSGQLVPESKLEHGTSQIWSSSATNLTASFGPYVLNTEHWYEMFISNCSPYVFLHSTNEKIDILSPWAKLLEVQEMQRTGVRWDWGPIQRLIYAS